MKNRNVKKFFILLLTSFLLLSGCVTENVLKKPLSKYLNKKYGLNGNFQFITWDNNWFEGIDHQTSIKINKPYPTTAYITMSRDSYIIDEYNSDDVYNELFKGAYIKQHPEVIEVSNTIIKKFNLMKKSPTEYDIMKDNFYYYLNVNIYRTQQYELIEQFKKTQTIDTVKLLPELLNGSKNSYNRGVINFSYYYNTYNNSNKIPRAENILKEFEKSKVLTEGIYCIAVQTMNSGPDGTEYGIDARNSNISFKVNSKGEVQDINVLPPEE